MPCPIAPSEELTRLREVLDECARCEFNLSDRNLRVLGLILDRVREAQEAGRVLLVHEKRTYKSLRRPGGSPTGTSTA